MVRSESAPPAVQTPVLLARAEIHPELKKKKKDPAFSIFFNVARFYFILYGIYIFFSLSCRRVSAVNKTLPPSDLFFHGTDCAFHL